MRVIPMMNYVLIFSQAYFSLILKVNAMSYSAEYETDQPRP